MTDEDRGTVVHRVCAWCREEFARETWYGESRTEITTWGICPRCLLPRLEDNALRRGARLGTFARRRLHAVSGEKTHSAALARGGSGAEDGRGPRGGAADEGGMEEFVTDAKRRR